MIFHGTTTKDGGPYCMSHPNQPVAFNGDACYKCRLVGVASHARLGLKFWIAFSCVVAAFGVFFGAVALVR